MALDEELKKEHTISPLEDSRIKSLIGKYHFDITLDNPYARALVEEFCVGLKSIAEKRESMEDEKAKDHYRCNRIKFFLFYTDSSYLGAPKEIFELYIGPAMNEMNYPEKLINRLQLLIDEVYVNGLKHGSGLRPEDAEKPITLEITLTDNFFDDRTTDEGKGFTFDAERKPSDKEYNQQNIKGKKKSGYGHQLAKAILNGPYDFVTTRKTGNRFVIGLTKFLDAVPADPVISSAGSY